MEGGLEHSPNSRLARWSRALYSDIQSKGPVLLQTKLLAPSTSITFCLWQLHLLFFYGQTLGDRIVVESMNIEKDYNISSVQNILKHTGYKCAGIGLCLGVKKKVDNVANQ
jgi:hypothetical protein